MPIVEQVGGTHYAGGAVCPHCRGALQHWDLTASEPYLEANATKYILRHRSKNGFEDLKKAISYIEKIMAVHYPEEYAALLEVRRAVVLGQLHQRAQEAVNNHNGAKCPPVTCSVCEGEGFHRPGCDLVNEAQPAAPYRICTCVWCGAPPGQPCDGSQVHPTT
jgi:hypothetical protein